jgi:hypothetical protein
MKAVGWIAAVAIGSSLVVVAVAGRAHAAAVVFGMVAPLVATSVSWVVTERVYARAPEQLTGVMIAAFAAKMLFFGVYVAVVLKVIGVGPTPFVVSFTSYFIALYLTEALLMRRLFARSG